MKPTSERTRVAHAPATETDEQLSAATAYYATPSKSCYIGFTLFTTWKVSTISFQNDS